MRLSLEVINSHQSTWILKNGIISFLSLVTRTDTSSANQEPRLQVHETPSSLDEQHMWCPALRLAPVFEERTKVFAIEPVRFYSNRKQLFFIIPVSKGIKLPETCELGIRPYKIGTLKSPLLFSAFTSKCSEVWKNRYCFCIQEI